MQKKRISASLVVRDGIVVQSIGFKRFLPVGKPVIAVDFLDRWGIDEIMLLDISATPKGRTPFVDEVTQCSEVCRVPLAVGGGIRRIEDIDLLVRSGADKVVVNTAAHASPGLVTEGANRYGVQCIVVSIDAVRRADGSYEAVSGCGARPLGAAPEELARRAQEAGAGEILITSIDRNGSRLGYDAELVSRIVDSVTVPVIARGGVGRPEHFREGIALGAGAVAAGNYFHWAEHSVTMTKRSLLDAGDPVRLETYHTYEGADIDAEGRLGKRSDEYLEGLRFEYIPEDTI